MQYLLILFALVFAKPQNDYIRIDHVGDSDKPIWSIVISKQKVDSDLSELDRLENRYHIIDDKMYEQVYTITKSALNAEKCDGEYSIFMISINKGGSVTKFCINKERALKYFNKIVHDPNVNDALKSDFKNNIMRISF